jgi:hypothetical protein
LRKNTFRRNYSMKKLDSLLIRIHADKDITISNQQQDGFDVIGLRNIGGEIIAGTYHRKTQEWKNTQLPASCRVISRQGGEITYVHVVFPGDLPSETYLALEQRAGEDIVAITPLAGPKGADLKSFETYFFRDDGSKQSI